MGANGNNGSADLARTLTGADAPWYVRVLHVVLKLLRKLAPALQIALLLMGVAVALYYGYQLRQALLQSQENVAKGLHAKLESTAHPHKGIAAFLLSGLEETLPPDKDLVNNEQLRSTLKDIETTLQKLSDEAKSFNETEVADSLKLRVTNISSGSVSPWQKAVTSRDAAAKFLMVPAISLRRKGLVERPLDQSLLNDVLKYNPEVLFDLQAASVLEPHLRKLDRMTIRSLPVVQTYFIAESGVIILHASNVTDHGKYYQDQFAPYTLFMDRPYFWQAVERSAPMSLFDYQTEPYIDLGGNGLVITYTKKVDLPNQRVGIVCADVKLPEPSVVEIKERLRSLGAEFAEFSWTIDRGREGFIPDDFAWFEKQMAGQNRKEQSRSLGAIALEQQQAGVENKPDTMRFTVPLESTEWSEGLRKTKLLWVRVDFGSIRRKLTWDLLWFSVGIALMVLSGSTILYDYKVLHGEMNSVLRKMSRVMSDASTPFAWIDDKNEFVYANSSFLKLLDYPNLEQLKSKPFRALVTNETQPMYDEVLSKSGKGEETREYEIDVLTSKNEVVRVVAHGERIPYPTFWRRGLPHRFGVFLRWRKSGETTWVRC